VVEPGHRSIIPEVNHSSLHHRPPEPRRPRPSDPSMPLNPSAALRAGHQPSVAGKVVPALEPTDVSHLRLNEQSNVVTYPGYCLQEPYIRIIPGQCPELLFSKRISCLKGSINRR
jgi:hypothetical protein